MPSGRIGKTCFFSTTKKPGFFNPAFKIGLCDGFDSASTQ